jgi:hypothetical protein
MAYNIIFPLLYATYSGKQYLQIIFFELFSKKSGYHRVDPAVTLFLFAHHSACLREGEQR